MTDTELIEGLKEWHCYLNTYDAFGVIREASARLEQLTVECDRLVELVKAKDKVLRDIIGGSHPDRQNWYESRAQKALDLTTEPKPGAVQSEQV